MSARPKTIKSLKDLRFDEQNVNKGTPYGTRVIEDSLQQFGAGRSIVVDKAGVVIGGNKTLEGAASVGIDKIRVVQTKGDELVVVQRTDLDLERDPRARGLALVDNRASEVSYAPDEALLARMLIEMAEQDKAIASATGYDDAAVRALLESVAAEERRANPPGDKGPQIDRAAELQEKWQVERGQIWSIGRHRLMCGDSTQETDIDVLMDGEKAALIWTDPPYGVQFQGAGGDSIAGDITYTAIPLMFALMPKVLDGAAWFYICGGANNESLYGRMIEHYFRMTPRVIVWDKCCMVMRHNGYHSSYEFIYFGYQQGGGAKWFSDRGGEAATDIWRVPKPSNEAREHLTEKPVELPQRAILNSCPINGIVLDFFMGSGGVMVAAEQTNRICYGMEIEPKYCAVTLERMQAMGLSPRLL